MDDFQSLRPHTLRQRLHIWLHREPVSPVPHWDTLTAPALPEFDVEAEWARVLDYIHRLADAGALDEAHGDLVDRDITHRVAGFRAKLRAAHAHRQRVLALTELQAHQHLVVLSREVKRLRDQFDDNQAMRNQAWTELSGSVPASLSGNQTVQAQPLPATLYQAAPRPSAPDEVGSTAPNTAVPALHAVPEPEREQA